MPSRALLVLAATTLAAVAIFMFAGLRGDLMFALELRAVRLAAILQVGIAIALSTVVFQTITGNRILTPSIMGMDSLFVLIQMLLLFTLGGFGYVTLDERWKFGGEVLVMAGLAAALFLPILRARSDLIVLLLAGVVLGVMFRSLSSLVARMIDPNEFAVVQGASYADFNTVDDRLLVPCAAVTVAVAALFWRWRHVLDVIGLGRETAVGLGVHWRAMSAVLLVLVGGLVAVSTALVGPVTFLGLLVVVIAERIIGTSRHGPLFLASCLVAVLLLVGGHTFLTQVWGSAAIIGVVIEFAGGLAFLVLLFSGRRT